MLRKLVTVLFTLPLALVLIVLSVANRAPVDLTLDPFNPGSAALTFSIPLFMVVIVSVMIGVLIGGFVTWLKQGKHRKRAREASNRAETMKAEAEALKKDKAALAPPPVTQTGLPLLGQS